MEYQHDQFDEARQVMTDRPAPRRQASPFPFVLAAGFAGAVASWFVPVGLYELIVESVGLPELFGDFAAPLGLKARLLIALAAGIGAAVITGLMFMSTPDPKKQKKAGRKSARSKRAAPRPAPQGVSQMNPQSPPMTDGREAMSKPRKSGGFMDMVRDAMSFLPAPRRYDEAEAPASAAAPAFRRDLDEDSFSGGKRLRPGAAVTAQSAKRGDGVAPRPIAAHAELGEPLPPIAPKQVETRASETVQDSRATPANTDSPVHIDSIEGLAGRLAEALGQHVLTEGDETPPQSTLLRAEAVARAAAASGRRLAEIERQREEAIGARDAARMALDEAEEAKARAERNIEDVRQNAARSIEEAEQAAIRADDRADKARSRLAALDNEIESLTEKMEAESRAEEASAATEDFAPPPAPGIRFQPAEESAAMGAAADSMPVDSAPVDHISTDPWPEREVEHNAPASSRSETAPTAKPESAPELGNEDGMDPALRDALRTLRRMTARN